MITFEQTCNLRKTLESYGVSENTIKALLNVKNISDITTKQYNFLKLFIYEMESNNKIEKGLELI